MPTISRFFGILIQMYLDDHPPPHFHAIYGESTRTAGDWLLPQPTGGDSRLRRRAGACPRRTPSR